ncbi:MAG: glycosyltransferase family 4 protein [Actinomycetota bacterium]
MASDPSGRPRVIFLWEMSAGHRANFKRVKPVLEAHPDIDARVEGVRIYDPEGWLEKRRLGAIATRIRPWLSYRRLVRSEPWDAVYSCSGGIRGNLTYTGRFPLVLDGDATESQMAAMPEYGMTPRGPAWLRARGERRILRAATRISAWSGWARQGFVDAGADDHRVSVISPGIDLDQWSPGDGEPPRATDERIRIVFVGGDFGRKGGDDLLAWFRSSDDPRYELHLVTPHDVPPTDGVTVHRLSETDPEMQELIRSAHVSVLPSRAECFGIASLEALACGTPVIQTSVGGAADIIRPGVNGALIAPSSPAEIGSAVDDLLADPGRYDAMRIQAREDAEARFSVKGNVDATVALILEAIEAHAAEQR